MKCNHTDPNRCSRCLHVFWCHPQVSFFYPNFDDVNMIFIQNQKPCWKNKHYWCISQKCKQHVSESVLMIVIPTTVTVNPTVCSDEVVWCLFTLFVKIHMSCCVNCVCVCVGVWVLWSIPRSGRDFVPLATPKPN